MLPENLSQPRDGIIFKQALTGGTALSRYYNPVRYSDDLDLFVNRDPEFSNWAERLYAELEIGSRVGDVDIMELMRLDRIC